MDRSQQATDQQIRAAIDWGRKEYGGIGAADVVRIGWDMYGIELDYQRVYDLMSGRNL